MKKIIIIVTVILLVLGGIGGYYKYAKKKKEGQTYKKEKVKRGDITRTIQETGIIKPQVGALVKVGTRATGTLTKLNFQVGDRVKKGDLIAIIDDRQILSEIDNAKAQLVTAESNLKLVEDTYPLKIKEQESQINSIRAQLEYAKVNFKRTEELFRRGFATQDEVDRNLKEVNVLSANMIQAEKTLERLKEEFRRQVDISKANIDQSKARLRNLEINLTYTRIYSPISGIVSQVATQEGETVVAGLSAPNLITILNPERLEIWTYIDETNIGRIKKNQDVEFSVDAYKDKKFKGKIDDIYPQPEVKENIVYYLAIVKIKPDDAILLKPDMTAHVKIFTETKNNVLIIPNEAIKFEGGDYIVYLGDEKKPVTKKIKVGIRDENNTEVLEGLSEGDEILIEEAGKPSDKKPNKKQ
ncbi:MAG: efflux RND transporter periplasmic adaptor subunit [Proteobacteria bacterium]|nr:efflux RND transporter periplasmic adaptor subunit [Pseudomonadota bacterium]